MTGGRSALSLLLLLSCSGGSQPPVANHSALPAGVLARTGPELVSETTVARIADRQGLEPRAAVGLAVSDALFAAGARERLAAGSTRGIERAAVARSLLEQLSRDAVAVGAPTENELSDIVRERWVDLNRPDAVRTTHAVVINDKPDRDVGARALAEKLAAALQRAESAEDMIRLAQAFPGEGFQIQAETLPFVTADGRIFERRDSGFVAPPRRVGDDGRELPDYDRDFARAANALERPGQLSPVTKSAFGYHVIRLEERLAGAAVPKEQLVTLLGPDVQIRRAARARSALLDRLRQRSPVQLERAVDELTARIKAVP